MVSINKILNARIGYVYDNGILNNKKFKGILIELKPINNNKLNEQMWIDFNIAANIGIIPKNFGNHTDEEINNYLNKCKEKIMNLKSNKPLKIMDLLKKK